MSYITITCGCGRTFRRKSAPMIRIVCPDCARRWTVYPAAYFTTALGYPLSSDVQYVRLYGATIRQERANDKQQ
jgi:hypothetical protein